ncbi:Rab GTPase [Pelomyxa schiedti]|nr:Rab GTPase [Pelomyxa schiedti]
MVHGIFSMHYKSTIGVDFALKVLRWDDHTEIRLQLWDIAGQERFGHMTRVYYREAVGAFIVFDITRANTFEAVAQWKSDIDDKVTWGPDNRPIPVVLLANKCDLPKETYCKSADELERYAADNKFIGWYHTSAKDNKGIDQATQHLVKTPVASAMAALNNTHCIIKPIMDTLPTQLSNKQRKIGWKDHGILKNSSLCTVIGGKRHPIIYQYSLSEDHRLPNQGGFLQMVEELSILMAAQRRGVGKVREYTVSLGWASCIYTGSVFHEQPEGGGFGKYPNGDTYSGEWTNGRHHSRGVYAWSSGGTHDGEWLSGKIDGWGVYHWADGSWYEGLWRDDRRKRGTWHDKNGVDEFEGNWVWDVPKTQYEMQGWGVQRTGTKKGNGERTMVTVYDGEWDRDEWHGCGTWQSPDGSGDTYRGQWDHGKKTGRGSMLFGEGGSYVGEWKDDMFNGRGVRLWANGDRYDGQWVCGKENGEGTKTWCRDGSSFTGLWEMGVPQKGMKRWPNGDMFEGTFSQYKKSEGSGSEWECCGEGNLVLPSRHILLNGILNDNIFQQRTSGDDGSGDDEGDFNKMVEHQMGSSLPQVENYLQIEVNLFSLIFSSLRGSKALKKRYAKELKATKRECEEVTKRNNKENVELLNKSNLKIQQLEQKVQQQQEQLQEHETDQLYDENKRGLTNLLELNRAFKLAIQFRSQLQQLTPKFVKVEESLIEMNKKFLEATEENKALLSHLTGLSVMKEALGKQLSETCGACKRVLGQTLTAKNSEAEIQQCSRNLSELTKLVLGSRPLGTREQNTGGPAEPPDFSSLQPFQLLATLTTTVEELSGCRFDECTRLSDQHTKLSKQLSEQLTLRHNLHKQIKEIRASREQFGRDWVVGRSRWLGTTVVLPPGEDLAVHVFVAVSATLGVVSCGCLGRWRFTEWDERRFGSVQECVGDGRFAENSSLGSSCIVDCGGAVAAALEGDRQLDGFGSWAGNKRWLVRLVRPQENLAPRKLLVWRMSDGVPALSV